MASSTRIRFADSGGVDIAYQVLGEGPIDLLQWCGLGIPVASMDDDPSLARFERRLASMGRLIRLDPRDTGMSDRGTPSGLQYADELAADAVAVLDAVGSDRAVIIAPYVASPGGITLAATRSDRVSRLVVLNGAARVLEALDYPEGVPDESLDSWRRAGAEPDAVERGHDTVALLAPSVASDPTFRDWWDRAGNLAATRSLTRARMEVLFDLDVRHHLPAIRVPTLVVQRADVVTGPGLGRYLGRNIPGANYVELPGADTVYWVGDSGPMLDEIEEFITGVRGGSGAERVLATVLFTDIVGSTDRAGRMGDGPWRDLLDRHDQVIRVQLDRFRGREVKTVGDGFVATFDSPGRAIECALAIKEAVRPLDIETRAGIHTGEIEVRGDDVAGMAVHIGARVSGLAGPGEVLVSSTVKDLVVGSNVEFAQRGEHELKGVPGTWRLFAVDD
ncbi:MAG TPA: adenylate/guanylate cyclase domain-containing protein [Acidimicrobiales bacterium]|nr:adenylate/guanylate cyclase domain-containing protein [Acidimicrobiales bacterium]